MPLHLRYQENDVIGCTSALIVVIYGVLAGFATQYLINNNTFATDSIQREANAVANIYRDSQELSDASREHVQAVLKQYLVEVLNIEWPLMNRGKTVTPQGDLIIQHLIKELSLYKESTAFGQLILADMLTLSRNLYDARQQRIQASYTSLSSTIWVVVLIGTILTLCVSYLFGVNFYLHLFIVFSAALMMASIIFLLISLDKPFQGAYVVGPDSLQFVLSLLSE
jgi:membrane-associated HD superfamily phosphohydrolase